MNGRGTFSLLFPFSELPSNITVIRPCLLCEVRIADINHCYKLKARLYASESKMVVGIDFDLSYAPVIKGESLLLMITGTTSKGVTCNFLDISNVFESNIIHDPRK